MPAFFNDLFNNAVGVPITLEVLQNLMLMGLCSSDPAVPPAPDAGVLPLLAHQWLDPFVPEVPAFTDAFAPVERYALAQ